MEPTDTTIAATSDEVVQFWQRACPTYDTVVAYFSVLGQRVIDLAGLHAGEAVIDIACGKGATTLPAARAVGPTGRVVAVDIIADMVRATSASAAEAGLRNIDCFVADGERLPTIDDATFDVAICAFAHGFFADSIRATRTARRVLQKGGRYIVVLPAGGGAAWSFFGDMCEAYGLVSTAHPGLGLLRSTTPQQMLASNGFDDVRSSTDSVTVTFTDPDLWWNWAWSHGQRAYLEQLAEGQVEPFREEAYRHVEAALDERGAISLTQHMTILTATAQQQGRPR